MSAAKNAARVLFCGSRSWDDVAAVRDQLRTLPAGTVVMHGGAEGADQMAGWIAVRHFNLQAEVWPADWKLHGKRAGILRNLAMLDQNPALVVAFWDGESRGTKHTIDEARRRGIAVTVVTHAPEGSISGAPAVSGEAGTAT